MKILIILLLIFFSFSCGKGVDSIAHIGVCDGYTDSVDSDYDLPYPAGSTYEVTQGNCSGQSHYGDYRYSYDFDMSIGSEVAASRAGTVTEVVEGFEDGNGCPDDNHVYIKHSDGSVAVYLHFTVNGASVAVGDTVTQGQVIGLSGDTGCSSGAHLHFNVWKTDAKSVSIPITFNNTTRNARGLIKGKSYQAN